MSQITIEPLHDAFGARVTGTALSGELPENDLASIRAGLAEGYVLGLRLA